MWVIPQYYKSKRKRTEVSLENDKKIEIQTTNPSTPLHRDITRPAKNKMEPNFVARINKKLDHHKYAQKCVAKGDNVARVRSVFLMLNREKYKQFSFALRDQAFWEIVSFKIVEFECDLNEMIFEAEKALLRKSQQKQNSQEVSNMKKKVTYYNLALKTLKKYDRHYGEKIGLALNRLFCKDISHYIRDFI